MGRKPYVFKGKKPRQVEQEHLFTELELFKLLRNRHGSVEAEIMMRVKTKDAFMEYCVLNNIAFSNLGMANQVIQQHNS